MDHLKALKDRAEEVRSTRRIHSFFIPVIGIILNFIVCFFLETVLIPSIITLLFISIFPRILFLLLPSCHYPTTPTPKMVFYEAQRDGKILEITLEGPKKNWCIASLMIEKENGEKEERLTWLRIIIKEDLDEDTINFDEGIVYLSTNVEEN